MTSKRWIGIAWEKNSHRTVCKELRTTNPITVARALAEFKKRWPGFRDYTIQPGDILPKGIP